VGGTIWAKPFWAYSPDEIERESARSIARTNPNALLAVAGE
jgi:hypothetical protein